MSNPFAVAAVTAAFGNLLAQVRDEPTLAETAISHRSPDEARTRTARQLNLFLYQVIPAQWRSPEAPNRAPGAESARPVLTLQLRYLLTAYGEGDDDLDAQHLLVEAMSLVHESPVLTREQIRDTIATGSQAVAGSDLADQVEPIRLVSLPLSIDELGTLWSAFRAKYRLSVAYEASVVLVERTRDASASL